MVNHTMSTPTTSSNKQKLIIVGNGMVGHHFAEQLVESGALAGFDVVCLLMAATGGYALWRVVRKQPVRGRGPLPQRRTAEDGA